MKKIVLAMSAVSALALAAPAAAHYQPQPQGAGQRARLSFETRIERLENRLRAAVQQGAISRDVGWNFSQQLDALDDLHDRYNRDGLNSTEQQDLLQRFRQLRLQIARASRGEHNREDYWYDEEDQYGQYGQYGQPRDWVDRNNDGYDDRDYNRDGRIDDNGGGRIDRNNDGFDDRDHDRDGRWDDDVGDRIDRNNDGFDDRDYDRDGRWDDDLSNRVDRDNDGFDDRDYDRDGRWDDDLNNRIDRNNDGVDDRDFDRDGRWDDDIAEGRVGQQQQQQNPGGVIGTLIDTFLGGAATLRVGDPAPDNLGGVPYAYQNQFRDGNGVFYRSDGRAIYEISANTRRVQRIFPLQR